VADLAPAPAYRPRDDAAHQDRWSRALTLIARIRDGEGRWRREMADVTSRYQAEWAIPLRDVAGEPTFPSVAAQLLSDAIDSNATRANDTRPTIDVPMVGRMGDAALDRMGLRRRSWYGHWSDSQLSLRLARAYRHLFGYDTFCLKVGPDLEKKRAVISTENPLHVYAEPMDTDEIRLPHYVGFIYGRTTSELRTAYKNDPDVIQHLNYMGRDEGDVWDVMYWIDDGSIDPSGEPMILMGIVGMRQRDDYQRPPSSAYPMGGSGGQLDSAFLLTCGPNRPGIVPVVCPKGPTLDRPISDITRIVPITDLLNKAFALDFIASEKAIFPDRYVIGAPGRAPRVVGGSWADGRTGQTNLLQDVTQVGELQSQPGPLTQALIANLERNARNSSGNPALFQGEPSGSLRSGNTVNAIAAASIDPKIKEAQHVMEYALAEVNKCVAKVEQAYWGQKKMTLFSGWPGEKGSVEYTPNEIWEESTDSTVSYPMPGMDAARSNIVLGQAQQAGMLSERTARQRHPLVDDAEFELTQITKERWRNIIDQSVVQQIAQGQMPLTAAISMLQKIDAGKDPLDAWNEVQRELKELQAQQAPPEDPALAMPGVNDPAAGGQMQPPPEGAGPPAAGIAQLVEALAQQPPDVAVPQ
jgi:hypothetical protein